MVFVKPSQQVRCTTRWPTGVVTGVVTTTKVEVDGMPRHIADCRQVSTEKLLLDVPENLPDKSVSELIDAADDTVELPVLRQRNPHDGSVTEIIIAVEDNVELPDLRRSDRVRRQPVRYPDNE